MPRGTTDEDLIIDDQENGLFLVNRRNFVDDEILAKEKREIFSKCWLYLGHESEIRDPGNFLTRRVGGRELIFVRGQDGVPRAFLNSCPHRGALVCREKEGSGRMFRCIYHSWAFDLEGQLVGRSDADRYSTSIPKGTHDLVSVPKLDEYRGMYFVNFDPAAMELTDYLAGAKEYIDLTMDQSAEGMEIVGGAQEYGFKANWKLLAENSFDGYHAASTHATYFDYVVSAGGELGDGIATQNEPRDLGNGHAVVEYGAPWGRPVAKAVPSWGEEGEADMAAIRAELEARFGKERAHRIAYNNFNMVIFPNLVINNIMAITVRTFYPEAPNSQKVTGWALAPVNEKPNVRQRRLYNFLEFLGPAGFATPDDCEALNLCQKGYDNLDGAMWNDISKGMGSDDLNTTDEEQMRVFWREWNKRIGEGNADD